MNLSNLYKFKSTDKILIDANILLFLFYPISTYSSKIDTYTDIFEALKANDSKLYICSSVISEFINRWLRMDFDKNIQDTQKTKNFKKDYRGTPRYKTVLNQILKQIEKLYKNYNITQINDSFENFDIQTSYLDKENDFNDLLICHISNKYNLQILTDDKDFQKLDAKLVVF